MLWKVSPILQQCCSNADVYQKPQDNLAKIQRSEPHLLKQAGLSKPSLAGPVVLNHTKVSGPLGYIILATVTHTTCPRLLREVLVKLANPLLSKG